MRARRATARAPGAIDQAIFMELRETVLPAPPGAHSEVEIESQG
jgi:hypothetical protein